MPVMGAEESSAIIGFSLSCKWSMFLIASVSEGWEEAVHSFFSRLLSA